MTYKIISTNGNQNQISIDIDGTEYTSLIVCNDGELDATVEEFASSIKNPKKINQVQVVDLNTLVQEQQALIESLTTRLTALENK